MLTVGTNAVASVSSTGPLRERKCRMDRRVKPGGDAELFRDAE
jgi:hypothetical protein